MSIADMLDSLLRKRKSPKKDTAGLEELDEIAALEAEPAAESAGDGKEDVDRLFIKMDSQADKKGEVEAKEVASILSPAAIAAAPAATATEPPVKAAEKAPAPAKSEDNQDKGNAMSSLFEADDGEANSATASLIASLPDIPIGELIGELKEVTSLIAEWQEATGRGRLPFPREKGAAKPEGDVVLRPKDEKPDLA
ncbi:MAG: hypothetical protein V2A77_02250 [Pseudomonadota bacterium]